MFDDFKNAFQRHNNAHVQLILINVVIFLVLVFLYVPMFLSGLDGTFELIHRQLAIPALFSDFLSKPWTILSYAFVHSLNDIWHIVMNMLMLYWFGRIFAEYLGSDKLVAVYVLGALVGGVTYLVAFNTIPYFAAFAPNVNMVGASAAVDAIIVATATLLPDYTIFLLLIGPVRIKYIAAIAVVLVSFMGLTGGNAGGNLAHLGGALIGFIYIKQLQAGNNWGNWVTLTIDWFKSLTKPRQRVKVTYRSDEAESYRRGTKAKPSGISQAEIDAILDKISAGGYESLSKDEKDKLFKASKKQ
jgi:membrane associated rhomboid family serine protease